MNRPRTSHAWVGALGVIGLALFILACSPPSWNPDGTQLVFTYLDEDTEKYRVAVYDTGTGTIRAFYKTDRDDIPLAQWKTDGSVVLMLYRRSLLEVSASTGEVLRKVAEVTRDELTLFPLPEYRGSLYVLGSYSLSKIDLNEFSSEEFDCDDCKDTLIFASATGLMYMKLKPDGNSDGSGRAFSVVVGQVDPETGNQYPLFELPMIDAEDAKSITWLSVAPDSEQFMLVTKGSDHDGLVLCNQGGAVRTIKLQFDGNFRLGAVVWAPDGKKVYTSVLRPANDDQEKFTWEVAEIEVASGKARTFPVVDVHDDLDPDMFYATMLAISPDGKLVVANSALLAKEAIAKTERGLVLIDVSKADEQRITRIPIPHPEPPAKDKKK